ncbi:hypothetical protein ACIRS1_06040 [Kitasatospora sp. NPDC101176]|uniref:hypothetical protein n=1 Tax=Kitasatospora sp. NPDC101176 TaxID=3364099 RepID=UPI003802EF97
MRSGRLLGLDGDAVRLAAVGLVRLGTQEWQDGASGAPGWLGRVRAASFADAWLAFGGSAAPGLRVPAGEVLRSVAYRAGELVLRARHGDGAQALEWLGRRSAEAREQARREEVAHPAEPAALALVWHGVQAAWAEDGPAAVADREAHGRRIDERAEAYVREHHHRQDALALMLSCARIAAAALVDLCDGDPGRAEQWLEAEAARSMPCGTPVPLWVPGRPGQTTG